MSPQIWLPATALFDGALTDVVGASLGKWRHKWFARPGRMSVRLKAGGRKQQQPEGWRSACGGLSTCANRERTHRLGAELLGFRRPSRTFNPADVKLLEKLVADASLDLLTALAPRFQASTRVERLPPDPPAPSSLCFSVAGSSGRMFDLFITAAAAAAARKSLVAPLRAPAALTSRKALQETLTVKVSARIGTREITAADLRSLAVNDVLVLDASLSETPQLAINGRVLNDSPLSLARNGAALVIRSNQDMAS